MPIIIPTILPNEPYFAIYFFTTYHAMLENVEIVRKVVRLICFEFLSKSKTPELNYFQHYLRMNAFSTLCITFTYIAVGFGVLCNRDFMAVNAYLEKQYHWLIWCLLVFNPWLVVFTNKRAEVVQELRTREDMTKPIVEIMELDEVVSLIQQSKDGRQLFDTLSKEHNVSAISVEYIYI